MSNNPLEPLTGVKADPDDFRQELSEAIADLRERGSLTSIEHVRQTSERYDED